MRSPTISHRKVLLLFFIATVLFSLASPILKLLIEKGGRFGLVHKDAISFCNVLFVGNFCAGLITFLAFPKKQTFHELKQLRKKTWLLLTLSCLLAVIYPTLVFLALEKTTIPRVVLISRFEGIVYALLSWIIFKNKMSLAAGTSYLIITVGVAIAIFSDGMVPGAADIMLFAACIAYGFSEIVSSVLINQISLPTFTFARNFFSAIVFFIIAIYIFGPHHFADLVYGDLWIAMAVYALLIIVVGQLIWFRATKNSDPSMAVNFALVTPIFTLFFAWVLLRELPTVTEWIAIVFVAIGLIIERLVASIRKPRLQSLGLESGLIGR